jgi:hypothetical protein
MSLQKRKRARILSDRQDFFEEKSQVKEHIIERGHKAVFLPNFHCKINLIEMQAKDWMANEEKQNKSSEKMLLPAKPAGGFCTGGALATTSGDAALISTAILKRDGNQLIMSAFREDEGENEVSLLDVPNWSSLKDSKFSVGFPDTAEDKVDIVFNAVAQPWYDYPRERDQEPERSSDKGKQALPILVSKDTFVFCLSPYAQDCNAALVK